MSHDEEPYVTVVRRANDLWMQALADHLVQAGCPRARARRAVRLLDAAFMGFELDLPLDREDAELVRAVEDLADAVAAIAAG